MQEAASTLAQRQAERNTLFDVPSVFDPVGAREADAHRNLVRYGSTGLIEDLQHETHPIFKRPTVCICALIGDWR